MYYSDDILPFAFSLRVLYDIILGLYIQPFLDSSLLALGRLWYVFSIALIVPATTLF